MTKEVYIADSGNNRIRKIDTNKIITTIAGTGTNGFSGDGGPATSAQLFTPVRVTLSPTNEVYIADYGNYKIRKIDTNEIITSIAGTGTSGYTGDGGPATSAKLRSPNGVFVSSTNEVYGLYC